MAAILMSGDGAATTLANISGFISASPYGPSHGSPLEGTTSKIVVSGGFAALMVPVGLAYTFPGAQAPPPGLPADSLFAVLLFKISSLSSGGLFGNVAWSANLGQLFIGSNEGGEFKLYTADSTGTAWTLVGTAPLFLRELVGDIRPILIGCDGTTGYPVYSTDGGVTWHNWTTITTPTGVGWHDDGDQSHAFVQSVDADTYYTSTDDTGGSPLEVQHNDLSSGISGQLSGLAVHAVEYAISYPSSGTAQIWCRNNTGDGFFWQSCGTLAYTQKPVGLAYEAYHSGISMDSARGFFSVSGVLKTFYANTTDGVVISDAGTAVAETGAGWSAAKTTDTFLAVSTDGRVYSSADSGTLVEATPVTPPATAIVVAQSDLDTINAALEGIPEFIFAPLELLTESGAPEFASPPTGHATLAGVTEFASPPVPFATEGAIVERTGVSASTVSGTIEMAGLPFETIGT
jgi:hypothetical protein